MAKLIIDLSGRGGLGNKFFGNVDQVTPMPNLSILTDGAELAAGIFNPFTRDGFLSPASDVYHAVTLDQTLSSIIGSAIYDTINNDVYWAERGTQIFKGDGHDDTALERVLNLSSGTIHDLEIYQINGIRKLFHVYNTAPSSYAMVTSFSTSVNAISIGGRINPVGSDRPAKIAEHRSYTAGTINSHTFNIDVPAGDGNRMVLVIASSVGGLIEPSSATFDGNAMTAAGNGNFSTPNLGWKVFSYINPGTGTKSIVVNYGATVGASLVHVFVFDKAHQTTPFTYTTEATGGNVTQISHSITVTSKIQVPVTTVISGVATHTIAADQTTLLGSTSESGHSDSASYCLQVGEDLKVGISDLPLDNTNNAWLNSTASGSFTTQTKSAYNFMRIADNGYAYLFADNKVHKIDGTVIGGTNGTVTSNVLQFPTYFRLTDGLDYRGNMFMVIHQSTIDTTSAIQTNYTVPCGVYIWDRLTTQVKMSDYVPVEGVRAIKKIYVAPSGAVRIICVASDGTTQIRELDGSTFKVVKELGIGAAPQYPDGLTVAGQKTIWLASDASIYCLGMIGNGESLARIGRIRAPQAETTAGYAENIIAGAILYGGGSQTVATGYRADRQGLTLSYSTGSPLVKRFYPFDVAQINSVDQTANQGDIYTGVKLLPFMSTVQDITILMAAGTATGSTVQATVKIYFNGSSTAWASKTITRNDIAKGYFNIQVNKPYISSVQLEIEYATSVAMSDTYDFHPFYAEVVYEQTNTLNPIPNKKTA